MPYAELDDLESQVIEPWYSMCMDKTKTSLMALPWSACPAGMFYRRDMFEEQGLPSDPAEVTEQMPSLDRWWEVAQQYSSPEDERFWCFSLENWGPVHWETVGTNFFDEDGELRVGTDPRLEELLEWHVKGRETGFDMEGVGNGYGPEGQNALTFGNVATYPNGMWYTAFIMNFAPETAGKWGMAKVPGIKGANVGGAINTVPGQTEYPEVAYEYIKMIIADPDAARAWLAVYDYGAFAPTRQVIDLPEWNVIKSSFHGGQALVPLAKEVLMEGGQIVVNPNDAICAAAVSKYVGECVRELGNPADYLAQARDEILAQIEL
jgi:ABC-type glycerol-3-phosphate transport system substrate-binding protein